MATYCVKCRAKTGDESSKPAVTKNGRPMIKSRCSVCGISKSRFVRRSEVEGGSLGSLFAPLLGKLTVPLAKKVVSNVAAPLAMAAITGAISGATHKSTAE